MRRLSMEGKLASLALITVGTVLPSLVGCTSSNTASTSLSSNPTFDSGYRDPTKSAGGYGESPASVQTGEPVYTIMALGTETGDVYPGDDYPVFAVVDNPDRRNVEYVWSCTNGELAELPQADRGRIQALIEQEDVAIRAGGAPADAGTGAAAGATTDPAAIPPADGAVPGPVTAPGTTPSPVAGGTIPGPLVPAPTGSVTPVGTGSPESAVVGEVKAESSESRKALTVADLSAEQRAAPENIQGLYLRQLQGAALTEDELLALRNYESSLADGTRGAANSRSQQRFVGSSETQPADAEHTADAGELAEQALAAARSELQQFRETEGAAANVADAAVEAPTGSYASDEAFASEPRGSLRDEYADWSAEDGEVRRRGLGGSAEDDNEPLTADESYELISFVTDTPYVLWTPARQGMTTLYCKLRWKEEDLTPAVVLEADVALREPTVAISEEFPDVVREDENVFVRLDAENLPDFKKGLFTLEFDPDALSFRSAELGEFFDDAPQASIFFAEPDKSAGKALLAIDSNTEIAELSGDGPIVYVKFKAKRDIEGREATALALTGDTAARYILDRAGDNILPLPVTRNPLRSAIAVPPVQLDVTRETPAPAATGTAGTATTPGGVAQPTTGQSGYTGVTPSPTSPRGSAPDAKLDPNNPGKSTRDVEPPREDSGASKAVDPLVGPVPEMVGPSLPEPSDEKRSR